MRELNVRQDDYMKLVLLEVKFVKENQPTFKVLVPESMDEYRRIKKFLRERELSSLGPVAPSAFKDYL